MLVDAKKVEQISRGKDPKQAILDAVGDLSGITVMFNQVLVGTYIRPEKTAGGIIRPISNVKEDVYQGKVGLVLKMGPMAFIDDDSNQFYGQNIELGEWIIFRVSDGWQLTINETPCRILQDSHIRLKVDSPTLVF